jgi:hypothetical protein
MHSPIMNSIPDAAARRKLRPDWWLYAALVVLVIQAGLLLIPQTRPGLLGLVCWLIGSDPCLWSGLAVLLLLCAIGSSIWRRPFWNRWRVVGFGLILLLALFPFAYRVYPSSHDERPSEIRFRVPLDGPVAVAWGGANPAVNYHVVAPDQRWAYDLVVVRDGKTYRNEGLELADYYIYGQPVLAPADGVVKETYTDARDMPIGQLGGLPAGGNQIVIEFAERQYLFLCHLKPGSISVKRGDRIQRGQLLAQVGNSGNTSEPHLHIHLQDTPQFSLGEGIPLYFHDYRVGQRVVERGIPTGGFKHGEWIGQTIKHAPRGS